jgi:hypothetical protein
VPEAGQSKINAEDNGKRPGLCSEDMDDVKIRENEKGDSNQG